MKLTKAILRRYRGVAAEIAVLFSDYNVIVGQNDIGKSTILKALDLFLNDNEATQEMLNSYSEDKTCEVELHFENPTVPVTIDEAIQTSLSVEELVDPDGLLLLRKVWDTSKTKISPEMLVYRKKYSEGDFILKTERELLTLCTSKGIETRKANGEEYNNAEKRAKLRQKYAEDSVAFEYDWEKLPSTGKGRGKLIHDQIKKMLPRFEYFHADSSLSESDAAIQKYFKQLATQIMKDSGVETLETQVRDGLSRVLGRITGKVNQVVAEGQQVHPGITFKWDNVVQTSFKSISDDAELPLHFRGDGFRRITMMAYFEHLAEERAAEHQSIIFGFEEPETFLHPSGQEQLQEKLVGIAETGYQVLITTHSPIIVANSSRSKIIHVRSCGREYNLDQNITDFNDIISDLGITPGNQFLREFERAKTLVLVEGKDDVIALAHLADTYKSNGVIENTFGDLDVVLIPLGGCDSIKHWHSLNILRDLGKPYFVVQDSDKTSRDEPSSRKEVLLSLGLIEERDFWILSKRAMENYLHIDALKRSIPGIEIEYDDFTHMKTLCSSHQEAGRLGGKHVLERHIINHTFDELQESFRMNDGTDEFVKMFECISSKLG